MTKEEGPTVAELVERIAKIVGSFGMLTEFWMAGITKKELLEYIEKELPEKAAMGLVEG